MQYNYHSQITDDIYMYIQISDFNVAYLQHNVGYNYHSQITHVVYIQICDFNVVYLQHNVGRNDAI